MVRRTSIALPAGRIRDVNNTNNTNNSSNIWRGGSGGLMDLGRIWTRKPVAEIVASQEFPIHKLAKVLGPFSIAAMGIGAIIGAGIFVLTGTAAALYAGPAITLSFVLAAIACGLVGLCYAELAAFLPVSGSSYTYTFATLGELAAWVIGWDLILEYALGGAAVAVGWSGYFTSLLKLAGLGLPPRWTGASGQLVHLPDGSTAAAFANVPAAVIVLLITLLLVRGTRESARANNIMVAVKLSVVAAFVLLGAGFVNTANWQPYIPPNTGEFGSFGLSGVLRGASIVFFAYIGFDAVSNCAQEARRPQRDMPIGILGSLGASTFLYVAVAAVLTGLVPYSELNVPDPIAKGVRAIGLGWLSVVIDFGALVGLTTVILVLLYGQGRVFSSMARDGLLPPACARIHPRFGTPYVSQITIGVIVATVSAVAPIDTLSELVGVGTLFAFIMVCGAVIYLRSAEPHVPRPFRVPNVPWLPLGGILACFVLMVGLTPLTWVRLALWLILGLVFYFAYGRFHSRLNGK
jgi:APA family basic amino acid/polyamine antiporter